MDESTTCGSCANFGNRFSNIGDQDHGNRNGFAVTSGGSGEGHWHRSDFGSDDYNYNLGMQAAYLIRPNAVLRDRFRQSGHTIVLRYNIPKENEATREQDVNQVNINRQVIQHFEMLSNSAQFVPGAEGAVFLDKLHEVVEELTLDNLWAGVMSQGDIPPTETIFTPQQFMQNAMMYAFFMRYYRNYGDVAGILADALVDIAVNYYTYGIEKAADQRSIVVGGNFAAGLECTLNDEGNAVSDCGPAPDSDGNLYMYLASQPHTLSILLMAHELDPSIQLCEIVKAAYDNPLMYELWNDFFVGGAGYWKGANQMMQGMIFAVGIYDTCAD